MKQEEFQECKGGQCGWSKSRSTGGQAGTIGYKTLYPKNSWKLLDQRSDVGFKTITLATYREQTGRN